MTSDLMLRDTFECWSRYHKDNPSIIDLFIKFALQAKAAGRERFSAYAIRERIRWYVAIETKSDDGFKISNDHTPYYARLAVLLRPELDGLFQLKPSEADRVGNEAIMAAHRLATGVCCAPSGAASEVQRNLW